jgi:branched-chain amino acid transport system permease protein
MMFGSKNLPINRRMALLIPVFLMALAVIILIPDYLSNYQLLVLNNTTVYFISALGITLFLGICGQMSFCAVSFMGLAGFIAAQLSKNYGFHTLLAGIVAVIISGLAANILGRALMRLNGSYLTFATIGVVQIFSALFSNWKLLCTSVDGVLGVPKLNLLFVTITSRKQWFYVLCIVAVVCGFLVERIRRTHLGRAASSVRDNQIVASSMGVNVYRTKLICFTIANVFASVSGVLLVYNNSYAVESMFTYDMSVIFVLMVMLGGVGSTFGTLLGSFLMTILPEMLRFMREYLRLFYGIGVILLMIFMPMGIVGLIEVIGKKIQKVYLVKKSVNNTNE